MNDRSVSLLERYDIEVLRTWKGRGAILFETNKGTKILREYNGPKEKVLFQDTLISHIKEQGFPEVDAFEKNKEGEILTTDANKKTYIVKEYIEGRDCNIWDGTDCIAAIKHLAELHYAMYANNEKECVLLPVSQLSREYEKHNKELKRIKNFIRAKGQKTDFEVYLLQHYDYFYAQAVDSLNQMLQSDWSLLYQEVRSKGTICHGDYQYHNIKITPQGIAVINFEKYSLDSQVKDMYLFVRKVLEKNSWDKKLGNDLITAYDTVKPLSVLEQKQLYYRLSYPEKFWKIVNFYYNSGKSWIPMRHMEKLQKLITSETAKEQFLQTIKM